MVMQFVGLAATALVTPLRCPQPRMMSAVDPEKTFTRSADFFGTGAKVTTVDVVSVLGRWKTFNEWNTVGVLAEMDGLFDESGNVQDGPALKRAWERWDQNYITGDNPAMEEKMLKVKGQPEYRKVNLPVWMASGTDRMPKRDPAWGDYLGVDKERLKGPQPDAARSAARRGFCIRKGQAQRWWHNENLEKGLLPFTSEALAASVGKTVEELDAAPPTWEACDVVFDALSRSQSGIIDKSVIDERRAAYEDDDGSFNVGAFESDLSAAKVNIGVSYAIFPGSLNLIFLVAFLEAGGVDAVLDAWNNLGGQIDRNVAIWTGMASGQGPM